MNLAIIPARVGSKRIPRKNIKEFSGKPMIYWPKSQALKSELFDHVIVSTEDKEISAIATACGAEVPFLRPTEFSDDFSDVKDVMKHAVEWLDKNDYQIDYVCCILATAVLLQVDDLKLGLEKLVSSKKVFSFVVCDYDSPVQRSFTINNKGNIALVWGSAYIKSRSQDLESIYYDAGQFYWGKKESYLNNQLDIISSVSEPIIIPKTRVQDIDTLEDLHLAKMKFDLLNKK